MSDDPTVAELLEENKRLRENAAQVIIDELVYRDGVFDATMKTGFGPILAVFVREMMKAYKGENFVTSSLSFADDTDAYYITFGRKFGKSVDEKYAEVCIHRTELSDAIKAALSDDPDWRRLCVDALEKAEGRTK